MFNNKKTLIILGTAAGVVATILLASLLSSTTASAQVMMPSNQNNTGNSMMHYGQPRQMSAHDMGMFSVMGMSMVKNVSITGASVTGDDEISVNVRSTGNGTSTPGIGVFVMTNHMGMMKEHMMRGMMYDGQHYAMDGFNPMMTGGNNNMMMAGNGSSMMMNGMQQWNNSTMMQSSSWASHSGSNFVKAGWTASGNTIKVKLDGASAYDARDIMVMVCPYLG